MADELCVQRIEKDLVRAVGREGALAGITFLMMPLPNNQFHIVVSEAGATEADGARLSNHLVDRFAKLADAVAAVAAQTKVRK